MTLFFILKVSPFPWVSYTIAISLVVHTMFVLECERVNLKQTVFIVPQLKSNHDNLLLQIQTHLTEAIRLFRLFAGQFIVNFNLHCNAN